MTNSFFAVLLTLLVAQITYAQMLPLMSSEGLNISYKWEEGKAGEQLLLIEAANKNDVALDFELTLFFKKGSAVVESTGRLSLCVGAGKSLKPKATGLVFDVKTPRSEIERIELDSLNIIRADRKNCHL